MAEKTTIEVSTEVWQTLNQRKTPGQSFDDVLREELNLGVDDRDQEERELIAWVRENQPAERSDIVDAFESEIAAKGIKGESWWTRHARPELEESGAEFTRNHGWEID